jgi:hypothetical protein
VGAGVAEVAMVWLGETRALSIAEMCFNKEIFKMAIPTENTPSPRSSRIGGSASHSTVSPSFPNPSCRNGALDAKVAVVPAIQRESVVGWKSAKTGILSPEGSTSLAPAQQLGKGASAKVEPAENANDPA